MKLKVTMASSKNTVITGWNIKSNIITVLRCQKWNVIHCQKNWLGEQMKDTTDKFLIIHFLMSHFFDSKSEEFIYYCKNWRPNLSFSLFEWQKVLSKPYIFAPKAYVLLVIARIDAKILASLTNLNRKNTQTVVLWSKNCPLTKCVVEKIETNSKFSLSLL